MSPQAPLSVAIVGGGLCGLSLAIALNNRNIPCKLYEARASFTEIGAGINLGPNTVQTLNLIDPRLGAAVYDLVTRNTDPDVWMQIRFGAPTNTNKDADLITELRAPPTGNMTVHRNDLLQLLANQIGPENAVFNKKLVDIDDSDAGGPVTLKFADGTEDTASLVIACDGVHSAARKVLFTGIPDESKTAAENEALAVPQYSGMGAFRAIIKKEDLIEAIGPDLANMSQILLSPDAYVIMYPIERGKSVNLGFWTWWAGPWDHREWVKPNQGDEMRKLFANAGETIHKIMALMPDPPFYATFYHRAQPASMFKGRSCVIGDAAHSMPPHQGAGAGQAMEDAYVMAEVLKGLATQTPPSDDADDSTKKALQARRIHAAFRGYESVRKPRSQKVLEGSAEGAHVWADFWRKDVTKEESETYAELLNRRFEWIWNVDIAAQAEKACVAMREALKDEGT